MSEQLHVIERLADVPEFATESDEADYWNTHTFSDDILTQFRSLTEEERPLNAGS